MSGRGILLADQIEPNIPYTLQVFGCLGGESAPRWNGLLTNVQVEKHTKKGLHVLLTPEDALACPTESVLVGDIHVGQSQPPQTVSFPASAKLPNGNTILAGGSQVQNNAFTMSDAVVLFHSNTGTYVPLSGRLNIPRDLMAFAGIEKEIVVSSAINIVEIWDKEKYEKAIDDAADDFADLAEEVMGGANEIEDGISTEWYENGQKKSEENFKEGARDGKSSMWYEDGQIEEEGNFINGKNHGLFTRWRNSGQKREEATFKDGELDGLMTEWYENGQKKSENTFKDGKQDGLTTVWYENGQKKGEGTFKDGKQEGKWTGWYENGQKEGEVTFKDGELISEKCWDENGNRIECK